MKKIVFFGANIGAYVSIISILWSELEKGFFWKLLLPISIFFFSNLFINQTVLSKKKDE